MQGKLGLESYLKAAVRSSTLLEGLEISPYLIPSDWWLEGRKE